MVICAFILWLICVSSWTFITLFIHASSVCYVSNTEWNIHNKVCWVFSALEKSWNGNKVWPERIFQYCFNRNRYCVPMRLSFDQQNVCQQITKFCSNRWQNQWIVCVCVRVWQILNRLQLYRGIEQTNKQTKWYKL